jgi:hypothetical protein
MKHLAKLLILVCLIPLAMHAQPSSYAVLYCVNPSGNLIPMLGSGTPAQSNYPGVQAYGMNTSNQAVPLQCDTSGNLIVTASGGTIATGTANLFTVYTGPTSVGPIGSQLLPLANQATNPATWLFVNGASAFAGTPDGTPEKPYTTIGAALAAASGAGPYAIFIAPGSYSDTGPLSGGTAQLTIYGNNADWTVSGGITLNGPASVYDLKTHTPSSATTYAYTGTTRSERHGGSYEGNVVINGFVHFYGVQLTNTGGAYTVTVNGTLAGDFITGGMQFKSGGTSALIALNNSNLQKASGYNFDMTAGGVLALNGGYLTTVGSYNIYLPTANTLAASHTVQGIVFVSGSGLFAGASTYYAYDNLSIDPVGALGYAFYRAGMTSAHPLAASYSTATCLNANVCWITGSGVPAAGLCTASTLGALYSNTAGGTSTTLYVCTAAGTWTAK